MKAIVKNILASKQLSIGLLMVYGLLLAIATFIESESGTVVAREMIYHSPALFFLQGLMVVNFVAILLCGGYFKQKRWGMIVTHVAFVVMLLGALVTFLFGREGVMHLREGEITNTMIIQSEGRQEIVNLPFEVELNDFVLTRYAGSMSPSSYESFVTVSEGDKKSEAHIYMNNTLDVAGYRLFQASYDQDEKGSILIVNQDVAGRTTTYAGYILLAIGFALALFSRNGRVATLFKKLAAVLIFVFAANSAQAQEIKHLEIAEEHIVPTDQAEKFGELIMQGASGRIMPVNTFASEVLRKLHKEEKIGKLSPEQFLLSLWLMPDVWINIPFIASEDGYFAYTDVFDENEKYIYEDKLEEIYKKTASERTAEDKEILKRDEKVNIFNQLINHQMLNIFPLKGDKNGKWYAAGVDHTAFPEDDKMFVSRIFDWYLSELGGALSDGGDFSQAERVRNMIVTYQNAKSTLTEEQKERVQKEIKYNELNIFARCRTYYLSLGGLLLILSIVELFRRNRYTKWLIYLLGVGVLLAFHFQMYGISLRWQISEYGPWSNSYETMIYIAWVSLTAGILFAKKNTFVFAVSTLFGGVVLFVSSLNWMEPQITPLVPVLKSAWLMIHVAVIVAAYGLFGISFLLGLTNLIVMIIRGKKANEVTDKGISELSTINEISLWIGLALMTAGTFLGAVWANESWGRYWGWDPKETWALITMIVYAIVCHLYMTKYYSKWSLNFLSVMAFLSVLMTYFGVNYFLATSKHSYNTTTLSPEILSVIFGAVALLIIIGITAKIRYKTTLKH